MGAVDVKMVRVEDDDDADDDDVLLEYPFDDEEATRSRR